jgi:putative transposase
MSSFTSLYYHISFGTKERKSTIAPVVRSELHRYLGGLVKVEGGIALEVGGTEDHVHILAKLSQNRAVADVMRVVKTNSSKWMHDTYPDHPVWWQGGYGAFSVSVSGVEVVRAYIQNQEEHHKTKSFEAESVEYLTAHGIEYDEKYLWA